MNAGVRDRGMIIWILGANRGQTRSMTFIDLKRRLSDLNIPLTAHDLRDYLENLGGLGYLALQRWKDVSGFNDRNLPGDELPEHIVTVKLTPRGQYIYEGVIIDPGVGI